jgi:uncharacterized protein with HEPN domain
MSEREAKALVQDIRVALTRIGEFIAGMGKDAFLEDHKTQDAVVRNLEIIGEAVKMLPAEFRAKYPDVPWSGLAKVRDKLIHHYFGVNLDVVWDIVSKELPSIRGAIVKIARNGDVKRVRKQRS